MFVNGKFFELIEGGRHNSEQDSGAHRDDDEVFFKKIIFNMYTLFCLASDSE